MSRKWNNVLRKIEERRKLIRKRELYPYDTFLEKTYRALNLLKVIEESKTNREIRLEARKNFIINCVTALEVFLKDMVKVLIDLEAVSQKGIDEFLKEKITLKEAWEIFSESEVSLGEIISITCLFQNLTQINSIFSKLLDRDFLEEISHFKVKREDEDIEFTLKENYPDWQIRLVEMFELRHTFVHQISFKDRLGLGRLGELWESFSAFTEAVEGYLLQFAPDSEEEYD